MRAVLFLLISAWACGAFAASESVAAPARVDCKCRSACGVNCIPPQCCPSPSIVTPQAQTTENIELLKQMTQVVQMSMTASDHARQQVLAEATLLSYFYIALLGLVTFATFFLTWLGAKKLSKVEKTQKKMDLTLEAAETRLQELEDTETHLMESIETALADRQQRFQEAGGALDQVRGETEALNHLLQVESRLRRYREKAIPREVLLELVARTNEGLTLLNKLSDHSTANWINSTAALYAILGFVQKRLGLFTDAFDAMSKSIRFRADLSENVFNAACYANLAQQKAEAFRLLRLSLERAPYLKDGVCNDPDFADVRNNPEFLQITGCPATDQN